MDMFVTAKRTKTVEYIDRIEAGKIARQFRRQHKLRLKALSSAMGVSIAYISLLERGLKPWGPSVRKRFQEAAEKVLTDGA